MGPEAHPPASPELRPWGGTMAGRNLEFSAAAKSGEFLLRYPLSKRSMASI
jgi:hypothetical protein